jgi:hypothetical protein
MTAKPLLSGQLTRPGLETGYRRGFSQLTFVKDGGEYVAVRFPTQLSHFSSRQKLGMNETCEEKL